MAAHRDRLVTIQAIPMPADTIAGNYISAGWLLAEMDKAGGKRASSYVGGRSVTVGIDAMSFRKPVFIGDLVVIETEIMRQGRSSVTVRVESWAERRAGGAREQVTQGEFTFVATDEAHRPVAIASDPWMRPGFTPPFAAPRPAETAPPDDADLSLRDYPAPRDTNYLGDIFGGWILAQMDKAGGARARLAAKRDVATVGVEAMTFRRPVFVGEEVSFFTRLVKTGRTSVTISIETWSRRMDGAIELVTEGLFTYVALDENRKAVGILHDA